MSVHSEDQFNKIQNAMKRYICLVCGFIYDEDTGSAESGIQSGTAWKDLSTNWTCPECGASREEFEMLEV